MNHTTIHPTAIIHEGAQLGEGVKIGAYSIIGPQVKLGDRTEIMPHVFIDGRTELGEECVVFPFASLGTRTQDLKYQGGSPGVVIGNRTTIREYVTVNASTADGVMTRVGSGCLLMAYSHVAHECVVGDSVIIANAGTLAGHVIVEDQAVIGGMCGVHQFVRIGRLCITGGCSKVVKDIPPFMMADGNPIEVHTINKVGMERRGVSEASQKLIKQAFRILYRSDLTTSAALAQIESELEQTPEVVHLTSFIKNSERGITK